QRAGERRSFLNMPPVLLNQGFAKVGRWPFRGSTNLERIDEPVLESTGRAAFNRQGDLVFGCPAPAPALQRQPAEPGPRRRQRQGRQAPPRDRQTGEAVEQNGRQKTGHHPRYRQAGSFQQLQLLPAGTLRFNQAHETVNAVTHRATWRAVGGGSRAGQRRGGGRSTPIARPRQEKRPSPPTQFHPLPRAPS